MNLLALPVELHVLELYLLGLMLKSVSFGDSVLSDDCTQ
jgi:hypothetical protein